ncbi:MAG: hypothetical protein KDA87_17155 [Planctomycetales bacterium]|nr:hypothetical protein [Planctomycetales bacterium]
MWRSIFLAIGIALSLFGAQSMVMDRLILSDRFDQSVVNTNEFFPEESTTTVTPREITPAEWTPWTLMSAGAVVMLYSITLKRT